MFQTYDIGQYVMEVQEPHEDGPTDYGMMVYNEKGVKAGDKTRLVQYKYKGVCSLSVLTLSKDRNQIFVNL
jgi:hypothetical protein